MSRRDQSKCFPPTTTVVSDCGAGRGKTRTRLLNSYASLPSFLTTTAIHPSIGVQQIGGGGGGEGGLVIIITGLVQDRHEHPNDAEN